MRKSPAPLTFRMTVVMPALIVGASFVGVVVVVLLLLVLLPDAAALRTFRTTIAVEVAIFVPMALVAGVALGMWLQRSTLTLLLHDDDPTPEQAVRALRLPADVAIASGTVWLVATLAFGLSAVVTDPGRAVVRVVVTLLLGGVATTGISFLLAERVSRPLAVRVLAVHLPDRPVAVGVRRKLVLTWSIASGVPILGAALVAIDGGTGLLGGSKSTTVDSLIRPVLALSLLALLLGGVVTLLAAQALARPLQDLRRVVEEVGSGDFEVATLVDDGSEIGLLQAGVNNLVAGLRERERIRDLFGRHVGADVATLALQTGVKLGGEERTVAALFVDVIGSTALATEVSPQEVVRRLNEFFQIVVDVVASQGGMVNKFEGDGALCVFGAPVPQQDSAACALRAATEIASLVRRRTQLDVAVGVAYGEVVAGQVGAHSRLEYTVIGDPVNEAARLTEQAKALPGRVAASGPAVAAAGEATGWVRDSAVVLRGRSAPTEIFTVLGGGQEHSVDRTVVQRGS